MAIEQATGPQRVTVAWLADARAHAGEHERLTLLGFARHLADLHGGTHGGWHEPGATYPGRPYFVPSETLTATQAAAVGIAGEDDLFGGVVPHAFIATKAISHGLVAADACAPHGWDPALAQRLQHTVLPGYSAFSLEDARTAGRRLLARGPVRVKRVGASGGMGQALASDARALDAALDAMACALVASEGVVLEEDVSELQTVSVGQVRVAGLVATYHGRQRTTRRADGRTVFGGSDLHVVRGGFAALEALSLPAGVAQAIARAREYDAVLRAAFPAFYASRNNYDVLVGHGAAGAPRCAVLEQSWRAGGATGPEIAALQAFRADPARREVRASCYEIHGESPEPPPRATVYFRGIDPQLGPLTKYTLLDPDDDTR